MNNQTKLVFVTQNQNKVNDARKLLPEFDIQHIDFVVPEIQSLDVKEIIEYKLKYAYEQVKQPCFVMDASLELDCLNGFPGPFVKWYFSKTVGAEKTCQIGNLLNQRGCKWTTVLGYFDGKNSHFIEESVKGSLPEAPRGENGYDWDVIFIPEGQDKTFAQMTFEQKQKYALTTKLLTGLKELVKN